MKSLRERVKESCEKNSSKEYFFDFDEHVEELTRSDFLEEISDAIDQMFEEFRIYGTMAKDVKFK